MFAEIPGQPLTGADAAPGGEARLFERGDPTTTREDA
jgi:hypothetical protein